MKIVIASGKGGTGKTTVALNLAYYLNVVCGEKVQLIDCDVETPNASLFLDINYRENLDCNLLKPVIDAEKCVACGKCVHACEYHALARVRDSILTFHELCHSCHACAYVCESGAIDMEPVKIGIIKQGRVRESFEFLQGELNVGEVQAPQVISELKTYYQEEAIVIIDAPPGTACSVVSSMSGSEYGILVTEPTPFGLNDLKLAVELACKMGLKVGVVLNRSCDEDAFIEDYLKEVGIPLMGKIRYDLQYAKSYSSGKLLLQQHPELEQNFEQIWSRMSELKKVNMFHQKLPVERETYRLQDSSMVHHQLEELVVISGKGGTGKTTITAALSRLVPNKVLADNDVDAANLCLMYDTSVLNSELFIGGKVCAINPENCTNCGVCLEACQFDAIFVEDGQHVIQEMNCEGCMLCEKICPTHSIESRSEAAGEKYVSVSDDGNLYLSHAKLFVGAENSGKLVTNVRQTARDVAYTRGEPLVVSDGPPGAGCPVISAITGVTHVLVVTEATKSGMLDLEKTLKLLKHFSLTSFVIINKYDLNEEVTAQIENTCARYPSKVIGKIPCDQEVHYALVNNRDLISHGKGRAYKALLKIWGTLNEELPYLSAKKKKQWRVL
ncbi:MAG: hypothetical protein CR997_09275 [Acidobacteria bacterium]|nr:MAG: hypothetical protein CR997_09275 [Acidobacteriota bacterium]